LPKSAIAKLGAIGLSAERVSDIETAEEMKRTYAETGWVVCPHTAVGLAAARRNRTAGGPVVTLATAHAAKFPETVEQVLGVKLGLPDRARQFATRKEQFDTGPMDAGFVRDRIDAIVKSH
jgi:threonine synthase